MRLSVERSAIGSLTVDELLLEPLLPPLLPADELLLPPPLFPPLPPVALLSLLPQAMRPVLTAAKRTSRPNRIIDFSFMGRGKSSSRVDGR
jgi:hypothetical protein